MGGKRDVECVKSAVPQRHQLRAGKQAADAEGKQDAKDYVQGVVIAAKHGTGRDAEGDEQKKKAHGRHPRNENQRCRHGGGDVCAGEGVELDAGAAENVQVEGTDLRICFADGALPAPGNSRGGRVWAKGMSR